MNQVIADEIYNKYNEIRVDTDINKSIFVQKRIALFKEYMHYPEELTALFMKLAGCYLSNIKTGCLSGSCSECCQQLMYPFLLNQINKYPEEEEVIAIESSNS